MKFNIVNVTMNRQTGLFAPPTPRDPNWSKIAWAFRIMSAIIMLLCLNSGHLGWAILFLFGSITTFTIDKNTY